MTNSNTIENINNSLNEIENVVREIPYDKEKIIEKVNYFYKLIDSLDSKNFIKDIVQFNPIFDRTLKTISENNDALKDIYDTTTKENYASDEYEKRMMFLLKLFINKDDDDFLKFSKYIYDNYNGREQGDLYFWQTFNEILNQKHKLIKEKNEKTEGKKEDQINKEKNNLNNSFDLLFKSYDILFILYRREERLNKLKTEILTEVDGKITNIKNENTEITQKQSIKIDEIKNNLENEKNQNKENYEKLEDNTSNKIDEQSKKNIELLGIFSAILTLVFSIINTAGKQDLTTAILLSIAILVSLLIFTTTIHFLFSKESKISKNKLYFLIISAFFILCVTPIYGMILNKFNTNIQNKSPIPSLTPIPTPTQITKLKIIGNPK